MGFEYSGTSMYFTPTVMVAQMNPDITQTINTSIGLFSRGTRLFFCLYWIDKRCLCFFDKLSFQ